MTKATLDEVTVRQRFGPGEVIFREGDKASEAFVIESGRVEISTDEGKTWQPAQLKRAADKYAWSSFSYEFKPARPGYVTFLARAWDDRGNAQPAIPAWNPLGYFWNGWHRVGVLVA